jgi:anti-sigma28 factor (negative regulator of flagellin synthesis)
MTINNRINNPYIQAQSLEKVERLKPKDDLPQELSKAEKIKQEIDNGTYKLDMSKTANKILDILI